MSMTIDLAKMTATTKDGTFPIEYSPSGAIRFIARPTPGTSAPTDEEHQAAVDEMKSRFTNPDKGAK